MGYEIKRGHGWNTFTGRTRQDNLVDKYIPIDYLSKAPLKEYHTDISAYRELTDEWWFNNIDNLIQPTTHYLNSYSIRGLFNTNYGKSRFFTTIYNTFKYITEILICPVILKESVPYWMLADVYKKEFPKKRIMFLFSNKLRSKERKYQKFIEEFNKEDFSEYTVKWVDDINSFLYKEKEVEINSLKLKKQVTNRIKENMLNQLK